MALSDDLRAFHAAHPACQAVLFGDLSTSTVLFACAPQSLRQEDHDAVLAHANAAFGDLASHVSTTAAFAPQFVDRAIIANRSEALMFLRREPAPDEVYCLVTNDIAQLPATASALTEVIERHAS